ncbi:MAG: deoxyguanosinetriphosphate triphosphohydrolase [Gammaproteobacteria bacterium]|nr:deoxyguanosinetriphosphate triphosphohydrolase [Gammaproteobacteria bacterium]MDH5511710.1 deoxyguanosinetriphosphate triphosphohydrolase [Gammaproteobacteria bacterium]
MLAPYAAHAASSRGRRHPEASPANRSEYQRDRDRIIHSAAFRRLEYKTQVFINHEGDLFRTRLTHSIEVAQIARSIARALGLNEDLTEAIALAHDLGHTPFGHSGQEALNECLHDQGGFEHNLQSLRVVDVLEERYAEFPGLNLTFETREGILKHCSPKKARELGELGKRFLEKTQPGLEAQLVNIADEIAYNNHDVDDGLRSELLTIDQLEHVSLFSGRYQEVMRRYPDIPPRRAIYETIRRMINHVVTDLIENSRRRISLAEIKTIEDARRHSEALIAYTPEVAEQSRELKRFLRQNLYAHEQVTRIMGEAVKVVHELFESFMRTPASLPPQYREKLREQNETREQARIVADYIAGMTDRYAMREHARLFPDG